MKKQILLCAVFFSLGLTLYSQWSNTGNNYTTGALSVGTASISGKAYFKGSTYGSSFINGANEDVYISPGKAAGNIYMQYGNIGVGTSSITNNGSYDKVLEVYGNFTSKIIVSTQSKSNIIGMYCNATGGIVGTETNNCLFFKTNNTTKMTILSNGNVGIGTTSPGSLLTVNGKISSEEIKVENIAATKFSLTGIQADYVFEKGYKLRSIYEVEKYIKENNHLPDIAPASETSTGVDMADFNSKLLQKVEELTLYIIELKKENDDLNSKIEKISQ
jgi:hypothetical protein